MSLSQAQKAMIEKARATGGGSQGVALSDEACAYLVGVIASDLELLDNFPEINPENIPCFWTTRNQVQEIPSLDFLPLIERLLKLDLDADTYFSSLAKLHKSRMKYERILREQSFPKIEQIGPRSLLEFGKIRPSALAALLIWRKWLFDIDNRAAQETGYLFEPILAGAIGGVSVSARNSPVHRSKGKGAGRQVDCIKANFAYEFKLRVTIAASGQGRWKEELEFPRDCRCSGFIPVLIVLDASPNPKLKQLQEAFESAGGESYLGDAAWDHLNRLAGPTMRTFLDRYVQHPINSILNESEIDLPVLSLISSGSNITIEIGDDKFNINRKCSK